MMSVCTCPACHATVEHAVLLLRHYLASVARLWYVWWRCCMWAQHSRCCIARKPHPSSILPRISRPELPPFTHVVNRKIDKARQYLCIVRCMAIHQAKELLTAAETFTTCCRPLQQLVLHLQDARHRASKSWHPDSLLKCKAFHLRTPRRLSAVQLAAYAGF